MRLGVRIALDLGSNRIGIAKCDLEGILASPVAVVNVEELDGALEKLISEYEPIEIIVGLPIDLRGKVSFSAENVMQQARAIAKKFPAVSFRLFDERLTTRVARGQLRESGFSTKTDKALIDAVAASVLLEDALEYERRNNEAPGEALI